MHRGILHAALTFDQIGHSPGGPKTGAVPQSLRAPLQALQDTLAIGGCELGGAAGPRCTLQGSWSALLQLPSPAVDRLPMHSDAARHFGLGHALPEQPRRLQAPLLEFHSITFKSGWMSHCRRV